MITDKDASMLLEKFKTVFATKEDLKNFATKEDIKNFTTKNDLEEVEVRVAKSFAENQIQMNDMKGDIAEMREDITEMREDITEMREDITEIKHNMLTMEDNIMGAISKLQDEISIASTHTPKIANHEVRITKLEKVVLSN